MFGSFKRFFSRSSSRSSRLYYIEIDDVAINNEISQIIINTEDKLKAFRNHLDSPDISQKEDDLHEIYSNMVSIQRDVKKLRGDVDKIISLELDHKDYFIIRDDSFLYDKKQQLSELSNHIAGFIQIVEGRPSFEELKRELYNSIIEQLNAIVVAINKIIADDHTLSVIYKKLSEL